MACCDHFCGRGFYTLCARLFRRKLFYDAGPPGAPPAVIDLIVTGLVPSLPLALVVVSGVVVKDIAGPSAILSVLIAAVTSGLSGEYYFCILSSENIFY